MLRNRKSKAKNVPDYRKNKKAFDTVMRHLRMIGVPTLGHVGAINPEGGRSSARNPVKPTMVEFRCDVFMAIKDSIPRDISLIDFHLAYTLYDSEDEIEREKHAQTILHDRRHSVEQRIGAEFVKRGIYPVQGRGYFYAPRIERSR